MTRRLAIAVLALACHAASPAAACPRKLPSGLAPTVVGEDIRVDGLTLSILQVSGTEAGSAVLERVERAWRAEGYLVKRNRASGWDIVSALGERCLSTLQLAQQGSAQGFFAVNPLTRARAGAPLTPPGARLLSAVSSIEDDGRRGTIAALVSQQPVDALRTYYMQRLRRDKWDSVRADARGAAEGRSDTVVVSAQRGRERIEVVLWREAHSHIVVNQAEAL